MPVCQEVVALSTTGVSFMINEECCYNKYYYSAQNKVEWSFENFTRSYVMYAEDVVYGLEIAKCWENDYLRIHLLWIVNCRERGCISSGGSWVESLVIIFVYFGTLSYIQQFLFQLMCLVNCVIVWLDLVFNFFFLSKLRAKNVKKIFNIL